jgi:hypothetical protein
MKKKDSVLGLGIEPDRMPVQSTEGDGRPREVVELVVRRKYRGRIGPNVGDDGIPLGELSTGLNDANPKLSDVDINTLGSSNRLYVACTYNTDQFPGLIIPKYLSKYVRKHFTLFG